MEGRGRWCPFSGQRGEADGIGQPLEERSLSDRYVYPIYEMIAGYDTPTISTSARAAARILITRARTK